MKKFLILFVMLGFAGAASANDFDIMVGDDGNVEVMLPEHNEHIPTDSMFDEFGCLIPDVAGITDSDMPCLDLNNDGCITRENWDAYMDYWRINTPEPEIPLCEQMLNR